ncbi:hypothetical protein [Carnimonas bestiolae]|uniref:hypothetical protein n=1 Tax=Carnimonas bestiolae TaxID=3402172 RepID=UPI003EDB86AB
MSEYGKFIDELHGVGYVINEVTRCLDDTWLNDAVSYFASIPNALLHHSTPTRLSVLDNDYHIPPPDTEYQAEHSPTVAEFYGAAVAEAALNSESPEGLEPFEIDGRQAELVDLVSGTSARVWQTTDDHQVIVSFAFSSGGDTVLTNPLQLPGQFLANVPPAAGVVSVGQEDAVAFTNYIAEVANERGISSNNIFVTGHSLGAGTAEYVAQQTGVGGVAFAGQGIVPSDSAVGDGSNFINMITYGDPWGTLSSDIEGTQPIAADFDPENGKHPHWGNVVLLGNVQEQEELQDTFNKPFHDNALYFLVKFFERGISFHFPGNQGADLGIEAGGSIVSAFPGTHQHGEVFDAGNLTIAETLAANEERTDYHAASLPDSEPEVPAALTEAAAANVSADVSDSVLSELTGGEPGSAQGGMAALADVVGVVGADAGVQLDAVA